MVEMKTVKYRIKGKPGKTELHVDLSETDPLAQRSFSLKEVLAICQLDDAGYQEKKVSPFWLPDNHGVKGAHPRFHHEHVTYMILVTKGLMGEGAATDLWNFRKQMIRDDLTSRAIVLATGRRRKGKS